MKSTQCHYSVTYAYMTFQTFREFMYYIHYKYMPSHRQCKLVEYQYTYAFRPILENICILICLAWNPFSNHATNHHAMYALVLISCFFACKASTRGFVFYARSYNFLDFHMLCLQAQDLFSIHDFVMLVLQHYLCSCYHTCNSSHPMLLSQTFIKTCIT